VKKRHRILVIVIRRSWPGQSAQACSSDVFPLPTGAEMIVTRFRTAVQRGGQVVTADRPLPGRATPAADMPVIAPSPPGSRSA
jgi:hypothetical protein